MQTIIAALRMLAFALICVPVIPLQLLVLAVHKGRYSYIVPKLWHKGVCLIFNIKVRCSGEISAKHQTIFMSNHISYLDIPAIASIMPPASFVAKQDVESWPVFGFLSKLQQTAFISRSRADAQKVKHSLDQMLNSGKSLIIFPEGTSTDGVSVQPFKSSLFELALNRDNKDLRVQPITLKVLVSNGKPPETQEERDLYSWHVKMDTELHHHLWTFAKSKGALLNIEFHPPLLVTDFDNRKSLSKTCYESVSAGLEISEAA